mmetsp:Transcript_932/g.2294  ORF Transcript_932/g.2294 Transcript_932/m.2294 type:complete len:218 (-) Transcript_932:1021-1674(-)
MVRKTLQTMEGESIPAFREARQTVAVQGQSGGTVVCCAAAGSAPLGEGAGPCTCEVSPESPPRSHDDVNDCTAAPRAPKNGDESMSSASARATGGTMIRRLSANIPSGPSTAATPSRFCKTSPRSLSASSSSASWSAPLPHEAARATCAKLKPRYNGNFAEKPFMPMSSGHAETLGVPISRKTRKMWSISESDWKSTFPTAASASKQPTDHMSTLGP